MVLKTILVDLLNKDIVYSLIQYTSLTGPQLLYTNYNVTNELTNEF